MTTKPRYTPALKATDITVDLGQQRVLDRVSISIQQADSVAIVGPNGSGKSTLVRTLAGLLRPASGAVELMGLPLRSIPKRRAAQALGLLAQSTQTPPLTTVREHVGLGRHAHRRPFSPLAPADAVRIENAMQTCQVDHLHDRPVDQLSGGERQRARLATLLAQDPGIMLLDEPLTGLDIDHQLGMLSLLARLNRDEGRTIVCVLHDLNLALRYFKRLVVIHDGAVVRDGPPDKVICTRLLRDVFRVEGRLTLEQQGNPVVVCDHSVCDRSECASTDPASTQPPVHVTIEAKPEAPSPR